MRGTGTEARCWYQRHGERANSHSNRHHITTLPGSDIEVEDSTLNVDEGGLFSYVRV